LGHDELEEFMEEIQGDQPTSGAEWLRNYLPKATVIYVLQLLDGTDVNDGWAGVHSVQNRLWDRCGGILQADLEGFTNDGGYHILWQFGKTQLGNGRWLSLLPDGKWQAFEMMLDNPEQKKAFLDGRVPPGAILI